jgi:DNA-binding FadR family transcriptional regulator
MAPIRPTTRLGDQLYEALLTMIDRQELAEGTRLPAENELALSYGVSRPIVRETLSRLRDEGLIVSRRGSGSYVQRVEKPADGPAPSGFGQIDSFDQIEKCYQFRKAIEGEACFLAATKRTPSQLEEIRQALSLLDHAVETRSIGSDADFRFHISLAKASGNDWFVSALLSMRGQIETAIDIARSLSLSRSAEHLRTVQEEHVAIFTAVEDGDGTRARQAMRSHLTNTCQRIFRGPQTGPAESEADIDAPG